MRVMEGGMSLLEGQGVLFKLDEDEPKLITEAELVDLVQFYFSAEEAEDIKNRLIAADLQDMARLTLIFWIWQ